MSENPRTASGRALLQALKSRWRTHILAIEATAAVPLDVERLALALHEERSDRWGGCGSPGEAYDDHMTFHQTRAERIAAEYARLDALAALPAEGTEERVP